MPSTFQAIVVSGPSGVGKSTLMKRLFAEFPETFSFSVSHTTRKPRPGEVDGKDYHFVEVAKFEEMIQKNEFLEHAKFSGNCYGTSKKAVLDIQSSGRLCILDVEINGVKSIKKAGLSPPPLFVFIKPKTFEDLKKRLVGRGTETEESLQKRLDTAKEAMDYAEEKGAYDHVIVNEDLDQAYAEFQKVFLPHITALKNQRLTEGK